MKSYCYRWLRPLLLAIITAITLLGIQACVGNLNQHSTLTIGLNSWPGYQIAFYGQTQGLFEQRGLTVEFKRFDNQQDNIRATMRGYQDASFVPLSEVMQADLTEEKPEFILVVNVSAGSDGIVARPGITSVQELVGKKVSARFGTISHLILLEALAAHNLDFQNVDIIDLSNQHGIKQLQQGTIDAAVLWEPDLHKTAKAIDGKVIHTTADVDSIIVDGLATRSSIIKQKRAELVKFIQVWFEIMDAVDANADLVFAKVAKQLNLAPETFAQDYQGLEKGDRAMNQEMLIDGRLNDIARQTYTLLSEDPRHGRIIHNDVKINGDLFSQALQNP